MLYFIYQFLQGIAHKVFTALEYTGKGVNFVELFISDMHGVLDGIDFPPWVLAVLTLIFVLAVFDKVIALIRG